jgi:catechol 2,3-dioxygenase-like lactoylglutathione lyase family enzyme
MKGIHHIAVQARDWDASLRLYRDVLGLPIVAQFGTPERRIILLDLGGGGSHIELFQPQAATPAPGAPAANDPVIHFALHSDDARADAEKIRAAGYRITIEPKDVRLDHLDVTVAFFEGPNGEIIEFFQVH